MNITIAYGVDSSIIRPVEGFPTIRSITQSPVLRAALGFGDNVEAVVNGTLVNDSTLTAAGDSIVLRPKSSSKG